MDNPFFWFFCVIYIPIYGDMECLENGKMLISVKIYRSIKLSGNM